MIAAAKNTHQTHALMPSGRHPYFSFPANAALDSGFAWSVPHDRRHQGPDRGGAGVSRNGTERARLWKAKRRSCYYCGIGLSLATGRPNTLTVDHIIPRCDGGATYMGNTVASCKTCNQARHQKKPATTDAAKSPAPSEGSGAMARVSS